jgi:fluoride exporter
VSDNAEYGIDPDVDLEVSRQRNETVPREWDLLAVIAVGGVLGAEARYGIGRVVAHHGASFPWSTVLINVVGSGLLGALMAWIAAKDAHRLLRPFVGVGILGGFTTFSTFAVDTDTLLYDHRPALALAYLVITVVGCLATVTLTYWAASRLARPT